MVGADTVSGSVSNKIKTAVEALDATVTGEGTFVDVTVTQVDGKITAVSVAESNIASTSDLDTVDQKVDGEITRATNKENELAGAIDTQKGRIDTLVGDGEGSVKKIAYNVLAEELLAGPDGAVDNFTTLQQVAAWIEQHPEDAAAMNEAIGTNTTAYVIGKKYDIVYKLPILIVEKMGPHFAVGDTCYSFEEESKTYNPDGKEIVAKDNECSLLRDTDMEKAYFGCHTDITIPYEELLDISAYTKEGEKITIIENGRFVLPGTEALNEAFVNN